ncbi:hypothetical protein [Saccharopolyspora endophytica]|uniref:Rad50/SbcC-type AAA domain-containing protein n=1 Tax=Saccharopolyspora endophytica TaxID=543886 RepID=A0ABS5DHM4_9PSEU|nr:hypothetical protein [Saccharopolyspora endophytica]MBQ0925781.1 hypothetical protein [Saccharopolyspora endophytica]
MTTRFRLDAVSLDTTEGTVTYQFPLALTVLAGPVGVGKSTLFELIKYGIGGNGELAPVAVNNVRDVTVQLTLGDERLTLTRSLDPTKKNTIRVVDRIARERLPDHFVKDREPSLNTLLLGALGLPTEMRAAARTANTTKAGNRITFADIFMFMYVRQAEINRDIASSQSPYREPKRKTVFELLFGLTDSDILQTRSDLAVRNGELDTAVHDHEVVLQFLHDSNTASRDEAVAAHAQAAEAEAAAAAELDTLRQAVDPVVDRETQTLRDLLGEAERSLATARQTAIVLAQQQVDYGTERRRVMQDLDRLRRLHDAGERLADFEFMVCPRCMQDVHHRDVPTDHCRLCLQPDPVPADRTSAAEESYEQRQLNDQLAELEEQLTGSAEQLVEAQRAAEHRHALVDQLSAKLDERTRDRITPQLQAYSDASQKLAEARSQQEALDRVLFQWDRADDLKLAADQLRNEVQRLRTALELAERQLAERKTEILDELDAEFAETMAAIGVPSVERATINRTSYLPMLNDEIYTKFSPAGGVRTATQLAYWLTLMSVALRRRDTAYPAFLLIDSPRTSLNNSDDLAAALYRRIVTQVDAAQDRLQVIIGDNELPSDYRREYDQLDFTYENPTISTVAHPGPAAVEPLNSSTTDDAE